MRAKQSTGVQAGWSYTWSFSRWWNTYQNRSGFLRTGRGFLGNRVTPSFCPQVVCLRTVMGAMAGFQYANGIMYFEVKLVIGSSQFGQSCYLYPPSPHPSRAAYLECLEGKQASSPLPAHIWLSTYYNVMNYNFD